ncbi:hypothetical protein HBI56_108670 [Parastagonospora nodorum]|nr:hypothetical protein HBH52_228320 [Parastagonospora nodorum]KAH4072197.1 hypothetical protein HBH50_073900 [Parastagonospora nodorum]KAH4165316.1 hypothetical protein HBH43_143100 [Parastagonospora nodorum]KAH4168586.1 hypothetical protein HBH44_041910 [Parastagonospora nodorum]KAH4331463.1 hypothetical protein HBI00_075890 [Parastagonospora nodorum]
MKRWKDPEIRQLHLSPIEKSVDNFQTYLAVRLSQNLRFLFVLHQSRIVSDCMDDKKCAARYEPFVPWRSWFPIPGSATGTAEVVSPEIGKIYQGNYNYTCDFNKK